MSTTDESATSTQITPVPEWDELPCVQYGFPEEEGPYRAPKLRTIFEPVPDGATTASPIYKITHEEYERQATRENPYKVKGKTSIATKIQDECETDDRVLYPIHVESDELRVEGAATLIEWFREFVEDYLGVPFESCRLYFSGNRSIHVHVPRFVSGERARKRLRDQAETFCEETGAELDCGLYYAKRMFRLPGVEHEKTGVPKLEIEGEWDNARLAQKVEKATPSPPATYAEVLQHVFVSQDSLTVPSARSERGDPLALFRVLDHEKAVLYSSENVEAPLIERETLPEDAPWSEKKRWWAYNAKEFSPYALATGNSRSVAALRVTGPPFARDEITIGDSSRPVHALIPAYFHGARGCAGDEYTKDHVHAPLQLSKPDYEKWDFEGGDHVVIIGGKSNRSRIFRVEPWQATVVGHALTGEDASRKAALDYLEGEGYDTGKAGRSGKGATSKPAGTRGHGGGASRSDDEREAAKLQRQAEQSGIETLSHRERWRVACRLLKRGWEPAWEWFKQQYGSAFRPDVTREQFLSAVRKWPDDYAHVTVRPR